MAFGSLDRLLVMAHLVISRRHQLRRFGREVDIGFGGSHDRILGAHSTNQNHKHLRDARPLLGRATVRNLPPTSISKFGSKAAPPPLGYFGTLAHYRRPPAKSDNQGVPPEDSVESIGGRLGRSLPFSRSAANES